MYLSERERDRRYELVRKAMNREGVDVLLVVGNNHASGSPLFSTGSFRYLTDFFIFSLYGLLLFFREDEPIMLVPMELQEAMAKKYSWIRDIRISFNYAETIARVLEEKRLHDRKIGVISMESLPASTYLSLQKKLPTAIFSEATSLTLSFRFIKGKEERCLMQKAGELNDGAYREVLKQLKPGMREYEVAGIVEGYHRGKGSDKTFNLVFSGPFPATKDGVPFQGLPWCPGQRAIEKGDCVHLEMTTVYGGYWNQLVRIIAVGLRNAELEKFHQAAVATTQSGLKTMKAGMKMSEVIPSMAKTANEQGFGLTTPMGHFVGLDLIEARVDADSPVILEPGVAMILHPRLDDFRGRRIILWGETYLMTEKGPIRLTQTDDTLHTV
ncbi:MAG TPA: Xaa-Pro peptidase family protein [Thermodesulfobacteriota bacterium]|nr:Xaa-Pro peptidase family protein [Thermodesulfobacteriota bacterium]